MCARSFAAPAGGGGFCWSNSALRTPEARSLAERLDREPQGSPTSRPVHASTPPHEPAPCGTSAKPARAPQRSSRALRPSGRAGTTPRYRPKNGRLPTRPRAPLTNMNTQVRFTATLDRAASHARHFDLETNQGIRKYREFVKEAADLVVSFGGSLSGEHGDGQSPGDLLPKMFGPELVTSFRRVQSRVGSRERMNPRRLSAPTCPPKTSAGS